MMDGSAPHWVVIAFALAGVAVLAIAGGLMTEVGPWYEGLRFPSWRPPNWLFGPVWTAIFALIAWSAVIAWEGAPNAEARARLLVLFAVNGLLNVGWSLLFFKLRRPDWALAELGVFWLSIAALLVAIAAISSEAAWIMAPYLGWVTFAGYLNWTMVRLNGPFGAQETHARTR